MNQNDAKNTKSIQFLVETDPAVALKLRKYPA